MDEEFKNDPNSRGKFHELMLFLTIFLASLAFPAEFFCPEGYCPFLITALVTIFRNLGLSALIFGLLRLRKEPFCRIGWTSQELGKHLFWGVAIFPLFYFSVGLVLDFFTWLGLSHIEEVPVSLNPKGVWEIILGGILVLVVAFAEEIIFRGYLLTRLKEITGNTWISVIFSVLLFTFGHAYEGTAGMLAVGYIGLVFSLLFLWKGSLTMVIVLHFLTNFIPIVIVPIMGM
ncbi:MAG: CPBP family intramembrane metalloprotease [bacterium]|nr:CPBP family intramembrane metalloprotease [bacterium]